MDMQIRKDKDAIRFHEFVCESLRKKDFIFSDLIDLAQKMDVFFVPHAPSPGLRWWAAVNSLEIDGAGRLAIPEVSKVILVPFEALLATGEERKDLFLQEFELAHELGHIVVFGKDDSTKWLGCSFMRLSARRKCPYLELRAFEEGIKIMEDILEKYDKETKLKQKVHKFFRKIYLSPAYRHNFSSDCVIVLAEDRIAMKEESDFCPVLDKIRECVSVL